MTAEKLNRYSHNWHNRGYWGSTSGKALKALSWVLSLGVLLLVLLGCTLSTLADVPPLYLTNSLPSLEVLGLGWSPSPDTNVTGYLVCWGLASNACTNQLDAGAVTNASLGGFVAHTVYYFKLVAYNELGQQTDPSNLVQYMGTNAPPLFIQPMRSGSALTGLQLSFQGQPGSTYTILVTKDFTNWVNLWSTNVLTAGTVAFQTSDVVTDARRFYRLLQQ